MAHILVTGASGFIALHVLSQLTADGHKVHASVRNAQREAEVRSALSTAALKSVTFFHVDLLSDSGWDKAFNGVDHVIHLASPFPPKPVQDPNVLIAPALSGTQRILALCQQHGVKSVVVTSSIAAVGFGRDDKSAFDHNDWSDASSNTIDPYEKSKTLAERAAWDYYHQLGKERTFTMCCVLPGLVFGPILGNRVATSNKVIAKMIHGEYPGIARINVAVCDVREVAKAHVDALFNEKCHGKRLIMADKNYWIGDIARLLRAHGYDKAPSLTIPNTLIRFLALFDSELALAAKYLSMHKSYDCSETKQALAWQPTDYDRCILDTAQSICDLDVDA